MSRHHTRATGHGWKARLDGIIRANVCLKQSGDGRRTGLGTRRNVTQGLMRLFGVLRHDLGYGIENPAQLQAKHVKAWAEWLQERWAFGDLQPATVAGYASYIRILCRWIGKPDLEKELALMDPNCKRRRQCADTDKSWEGKGLDIGALIERAMAEEPWVGYALLAQAAFGLRRKEAVCLVPAQDYVPQAGVLLVTRGTKGGRPRQVQLYTAWQFEVMAVLIHFCQRGAHRKSHLGGDGRSLASNLRRYSYILSSKLGVSRDLAGTTGHGLRAGFACRLLSAYGVTAPVRGGDPAVLAPEVVGRAYKATTEALGHSRTDVCGAYVGSKRAGGGQAHPDGPDASRIDPPDMDGLVASMAARWEAELGGVRTSRRLAKAAGLTPTVTNF